ncbi:MAG: hypothetical protein HY862_19420 [Chloroflexi bacterium]|nr:hypothetical protein [Chloroflexota bacterium]
MMRILKGLGLFISGLGISLVVGWWLSQQERHAKRTGSPAPDVTEATIEPAIVLPPEAFEGVIEPVQPKGKIELKPDKAETKREADDLTIIKGIGPKKAEALASIGITTFDGLGTADANELKDKLAGIGSLEQLEEWIAAAKEFQQ